MKRHRTASICKSKGREGRGEGGRGEGRGREGGGRESDGATIIDVRVTVVRTARAKAIMRTTKKARKKRSNEDMSSNERGGGGGRVKLQSAGNSLDRAGRGEQREQGEEWDAIVVSGQK